MVPKRPVFAPEALRMASISEVVVVFPFVPVTATSCKASAGCPKKFAAVTANALRASSTWIQATLEGIAAGALSSLAIAAAPSETASRINVFPSAFAPRKAKKSARGCTLRESQATWRISISCAAGGIFASVPRNKSRSFKLRGETRGGDESCRPSSAWFVLELQVSSSWLNPVLILIPDSRARLRFLLERCPELHGDFGAASDLGSRRRRLRRCKVAANQNGFEPQPQNNVCHVTHGLPAEVRHFNVAALIHGNRQDRLQRSRLLAPNYICQLGCSGRRVGLAGEIHGRGIFEGAPILLSSLQVSSLDELWIQRNIARHVEIRQDLFCNAFENRRGHLATFVQPDGRV